MNRKNLILIILLLGVSITNLHSTNRDKIFSFEDVDKTLTALSEKIKVRHTPKGDYVSGIATPQLSLNGTWQFHPSPETDFEKKIVITKEEGWNDIEVPSEWYMQSYTVEKGQWAGYYKTLHIPEDWKDKRVIIRFGAVNSECKLFINGSFAGSHIGTMNQFEFEITPFLNYNQDRLAIYVRSESLADEIGRISHYARHQVGGILRSVTLMALPQVHISEFHSNASLSSDLKKGAVQIQFSMDYPENVKTGNTEVEVILKKRGIEGLQFEEGEIDRKRIKINHKKNDYKIDITINNPELWHAESPYLYTVEWNIYDNKKLTASGNQLIGFRRIEIVGNVLMVNNKKVKLKGVAMHDITPYEGRAIKDTADIRRDVELFRNANCNHIRTAHYPKDEYFMELCDRYGIFVEDEAPVCWMWDANDKIDVIEKVLYGFKSLIYRDRHHPSVLVWSIANESRWSPKFMMCYKLAKQLTPDIPVKFSHSEYFEIVETLDVGSRHYPGWQGLLKYTNYFRPIFFDEALHLNAYNTSENITDPGLRDLWGDYIKYFMEQLYQGPAIAGLGIWSGIDEMFYPLNQEPIGYGPWGIVDGFRREKPEFWHTKMAYSPVQVVSKNFQSVNNQTIVSLDNRYDISNLNNLQVEWHDGNKSGSTKVNGEAGEHSYLVLPFEMESDTLGLTFYDKRGFMVSQWNIPRTSPYYLIPQMHIHEKVTTIRNREKISVSTPNTHYQFCTKTGILEQISQNGKSVSENGVQLYLIPLSASSEMIDFIPQEMADKKVKFISEPETGWICDTLFTEVSDSLVRITCQGKYDTIPASFTYLINGDGHLKVNYIVKLKDIDVSKLRQIGIGFDLPGGYDNLVWKRDGIWTAYPHEHIGRNQGTTKAFYPETLDNYFAKRQTPVHSYAREGNSFGCNDFRSTKHNIFEASLSNEAGNKVQIESNGKQHFRSWITEKGVSFMLANYSNGGNEHYLSFNSDRTRISPEELKLDGGDFAGWIQINWGN